MSSPAHSSRRLCPLRAFRLSRSRRRLASASALNTSSSIRAILRYAAARMPEPYAAQWLHVNIGWPRCPPGTRRTLTSSNKRSIVLIMGARVAQVRPAQVWPAPVWPAPVWPAPARSLSARSHAPAAPGMSAREDRAPGNPVPEDAVLPGQDILPVLPALQGLLPAAGLQRGQVVTTDGGGLLC